TIQFFNSSTLQLFLPAPAGLNVCSPGRDRRSKSRDIGVLGWPRATGNLSSGYDRGLARNAEMVDRGRLISVECECESEALRPVADAPREISGAVAGVICVCGCLCL